MNKEHRIFFIDFARGLAIFFMILQHAVLVYDKSSGSDSGLGRAIILMGTAPSAPVFMFAMGIFFARANVANPVYGITRGLKLLALGYVLNLVRFCLPVMILGKYGLVIEGNMSILTLFFIVDILQMAGLSLIVMALIRRFVRRPWIWIVMAASVTLVSPMLWGRLGEIPGFALLWGEEENVFFPLFPWIIYPMTGMFYGHYLLSYSDLGRLMKKSFWLGLVIIAAGSLMWRFFSNEVLVVGSYARSGPPVHLVMMGYIFSWMAFCWWITKRAPDNRIFSVLYFWSKNVTEVYFIQWLLIGWGLFLVHNAVQHTETALVLGLFIVLLAHVLTRIYVYILGQFVSKGSH